ncbi:substrate-binding periplasmic protein [Cerasicoccus arenae]|uniref:Amino acid ABC transporter substrate-binding protein n=1 Tax=Cerasicoccus arenae TaxID=424488 RepID=A0A8J3GGE6_9BACT|nr:transporter substrate-binding domain-containing protein [Cerasicoccus arenae]MBK1859294.1 amino acid ABC transporter substrate-binding protein [Cerasicoccus arenae]GHC13371.1 amino acid ABC transporter substrate-binding protein [Cerasicoccus arenae]
MRLLKMIAQLGLCLLLPLSLIQGETEKPVAPSPFKTKPLRVGVTSDSPPLAFKVGDEMEGVEIDLARLLGKELGRPVVFVETPWGDQITALRENKTDIIMSGMTVTREREDLVAFSPPYLNFGQMSLVRKNIRARYTSVRSLLDTNGKVAVIPNTTGAAFVKENFKNAEIVSYDSPDAATDAVVRGQVDAFIYDSPVILWLAGKREMEDVVPVNINLTIEYLAWAMRQDDAKLQEQVAKAMMEFESDGRLQTVIDRWLPRY